MAGNDRQRLDSWKDIAQHLGRDLSTVRRWEKDKGLPVHRVPGGSRHAVFAWADEIEAWLTGHRNGVAEEPRVSPKKGVLWLVSIPAFGLGLLLILFLWTNYRTSAAPDSITFNGNKVIAWDASGKRAWEYEFPFRVRQLAPEETARAIRIVDLDGDGKPEILAVPVFDSTDSHDAQSSVIYCFSSSGKLLWEYRPTSVLQFDDRTFEGPWDLSALLVTFDRGAPAIWASFVHHTWFPSIVVRLDRYGRGETRFVNAGWITELAYVERPEGSYLLAGGANNTLDAGVLAVLDVTKKAASSPDIADFDSSCRNCPREKPFRYFVFSRSELNRLERAAINIVRFIEVSPSRIEVRTEEVPARKNFENVFGIYELSPELTLRRVAATDNYWDFHRLLEDEKRIGHTHAACRERMALSPVRIWTADGEWTDARAGEVAVSRAPRDQRNSGSAQ